MEETKIKAGDIVTVDPFSATECEVEVLSIGNVVARVYNKESLISYNVMVSRLRKENGLQNVFRKQHTYTCIHAPTNETWFILAVHRESGKCFAAGYPPSIAEIHDCYNWERRDPIDEGETKHVNRHFRHTFD